MPTPFDQDEYPSSPPTAPSWTVPAHPTTDPGWTTTPPGWGQQAPPPSAPPGKKPSSASRMAVAAVILTALLVGSVAGGVASWFAFARSDGTTTEARSGALAPTQPRPGQGSAQSTPDQSTQPLAGWDDVTKAIDPGIVDIESQLAGGVGAGTGMVLSADGLILTNNHVVEGARSIVVTVVTTGETYRATIVGTDPAQDVAVVQMTGATDLTPIPLGDSDQVAVGDQVAAIGNAGGRGGTPSVATGSVTALGQQITATAEDGSDAQTLQDMIQVAADVVPGDSGGALADDTGHVVGMTTAASATNGTGRMRAFRGSSAGEGYAIPINRALDVAKQLEASGSGSSEQGSTSGGSSSQSSGGYLGVQVAAGTSDGVEIVGVMSGSPAAGAGLAIGDTIVAVDDSRLSSPTDLVDLLSQHDPGDTVTITWFGTDGRAHQGSVTLASR